MKKIKNQYLDQKIPCPLTKQIVSVRMIPTGLYDIYASKGYDFLFEEVEVKKVNIKIEKNKEDLN